MKNFLSSLIIFVSVSVSNFGATLWTQDTASVPAVTAKVGTATAKASVPATVSATTPTSTSSVYRDSRTETHRVVIVYNSRSEIVGTNYITEVRDYLTGEESYNSVSHLAETPPQPRVVLVPCPPAPCYQGGGWTSVFPGNDYSSSVSSCNDYSGSTSSCSVRSGSVSSGSVQPGSQGPGSVHGDQVSSWSQFGGGVRAGQTFAGGIANRSSYSSIVYGGNVYPSGVGYVTEHNYSWGAGVTVGGQVSSGLSPGGGSSHAGNFSGGSVSPGSVSNGSIGSGSRRHH